MRTLRHAITVAMAAASIFAGHASQPVYHRAVTGTLLLVGGPPPGVSIGVRGRIVARSAAGHRFTTRAGKHGRFLLSLPVGRYRFTGRSPLIRVNGRETLCTAQRPVRVTRHKPIRKVVVACSVP